METGSAVGISTAGDGSRLGRHGRFNEFDERVCGHHKAPDFLPTIDLSVGGGEFLSLCASKFQRATAVRWGAGGGARKGLLHLKKTHHCYMKLPDSLILSILVVSSVCDIPAFSAPVESIERRQGNGKATSSKSGSLLAQHQDVCDRGGASKSSVKKTKANVAVKPSTNCTTAGSVVLGNRTEMGRAKSDVAPIQDRHAVLPARCALPSIDTEVSILDEVAPHVPSRAQRDLDRNRDGVVDPMERAMGRIDMSVKGDIGLRGVDMLVERLHQGDPVLLRSHTFSSVVELPKEPSQVQLPRAVKQPPPRKRVAVTRVPAH